MQFHWMWAHPWVTCCGFWHWPKIQSVQDPTIHGSAEGSFHEKKLIQSGSSPTLHFDLEHVQKQSLEAASLSLSFSCIVQRNPNFTVPGCTKQQWMSASTLLVNVEMSCLRHCLLRSDLGWTMLCAHCLIHWDNLQHKPCIRQRGSQKKEPILQRVHICIYIYYIIITDIIWVYDIVIVYVYYIYIYIFRQSNLY
jgi:hypothetical protein